MGEQHGFRGGKKQEQEQGRGQGLRVTKRVCKQKHVN